MDSWKLEHGRGIEFRFHRRNRVTCYRSRQRWPRCDTNKLSPRFQRIRDFLGQRCLACRSYKLPESKRITNRRLSPLIPILERDSRKNVNVVEKL